MNEQSAKSRFPEAHSNYDEALERVAGGYREVEHLVQRNPASSVFLAFGVGIGIGVWLGSSMVHASRFRQPAPVAERLGRRVLEALSGMVPDSVSESLRR